MRDQAVSVKVVFSKMTIFTAVLAVALSMVYLYESKQTSRSFFTYYGNITKQTTFTSPEEIKSLSFGYSANGQPLDLSFISQLWCKPLDSTSIKFDLIATRSRDVEDFNGFNQVDGIFMKAISETTSLSQIGLHDAEQIRQNGKVYQEWTLGNVRPSIDSVCYINSDISTKTKLFDISKNIQFDGNLFEYLVEPE